MVDHEADDALASAAAVAAADDRVDQVVIHTPDKDLGQCCTHPKVVQLDKRARQMRNADGVFENLVFGQSRFQTIWVWWAIALMAFPGFLDGARKAHRYCWPNTPTLRIFLPRPDDWAVTVRSAAKLASTLQSDFENALLFRRLATLDTDVEVGDIDDWKWTRPTKHLPELAAEIDSERLVERIRAL